MALGGRPSDRHRRVGITERFKYLMGFSSFSFSQISR